MSETVELPLTHRQHLAIAAILASSSLEEARRQLRAGKDTFYSRWLKQPAFQEELKRQRQAVVDAAFNRLKTSMVKAVEKLLDLMQAEGQPSIQLRAAEGILSHGLKAWEQQELEDRIEALEQKVHEKGDRRWH